MAILIDKCRIFDVDISSYEVDYSQATEEDPCRGAELTVFVKESKKRNNMPPLHDESIDSFVYGNFMKDNTGKWSYIGNFHTCYNDFDYKCKRLNEIWDKQGYLMLGDFWEVYGLPYKDHSGLMFMYGNHDLWKRDLSEWVESIDHIYDKVCALSKKRAFKNSEQLDNIGGDLSTLRLNIRMAQDYDERMFEKEEDDD